MPNGPAKKASRYMSQRVKTPVPMVPLSVARRTKGLTLQAVCDHINNEFSFSKPVERGTISAIENGHRGASVQMLAAIASAIGIESAEIDTQYEPRQRRGVA
ncbi:helix-turn-helix domain-containing protein [Mycobacteroides abscessus]|uniref:helix-turn-helix domain-containing protein n=1 Tax=Mycobacteroides abscessus TaxID=36809 RepID=UPI0005E8281F|nr:helix-turn-helix transcriptional regulator [Mycobacteroides abscessus]QSM02835.1 helix-turn-helix DNA binding domain protein [Mycobacterium phage prophi58-1]MBN7468617.1 helix-turn-helix transcriptional regulator [Mycobacteroides abscessus subsp. massiliense]MDO3010080.1 helix-turn-helix transcriptional regulator [Mycobacteroides abscessus subsp. abscessus]PVB13005.1 XRE family transcriptional regulator [Mycobacteroides abscessus]RIR99501.1 XRE family transcriptional regulator [Mycobacteroi